MILQNSLIAKANSEQVTSFEYYDLKNHFRVTGVKVMVIQAYNKLLKIEENLGDVKDKLQKNELFLREYDEITAKYEYDKNQLKKDKA